MSAVSSLQAVQVCCLRRSTAPRAPLVSAALLWLFAAAGAVHAQQGLVNDPNLPRPYGSRESTVEWSWVSGDLPSVTIRSPQFAPNGVGASTYLGWDEQGSYLVNFQGKVLCYVLKTDSLLECYSSQRDIPLEVLRGLHNPHVEFLLPHPKAAPAAVAPTPRPPNPRAGLFPDADIRAALTRVPQGVTPADASAAANTPFIGSGASVHGGVLTFTAKDGSHRSYKVERLAVPGAPTGTVAGAGADTGAWIAFSDNKICNLQSDGTVAVSQLDPRMRAQFLRMKQIAVGAH